MDQSQGDGACFGDYGRYRYLLWRIWDKGLPHLLWILLNPSTADAKKDDSTLIACRNFGTAWGFGGLEIVNLFACITSNPVEMKKLSDPIGPDNNHYISDAAKRIATEPDSRIVVAWGRHGSHLGRDQQVLHLLRQHTTQPLYCLVKNRDGSPHHPLYLPCGAELMPYQ